ncbi:hypothetical protein BofuT4_uP143280.1 [Botrytis cinerea T4]|uniref:Uncharacterized protein n=1 Tax=Botryotinia fuckeliana (strain T4) TaxID=999810 RepID=G2YZL8_BOTF4|nr:hypothetical protein BofuT4_uP143280.1 [Botrytis cinerea T4]
MSTRTPKIILILALTTTLTPPPPNPKTKTSFISPANGYKSSSPAIGAWVSSPVQSSPLVP